MSVTAVPIRPLKKGSVAKLWIGLGVLALLVVAVAWFGTRGFQTVATESGVQIRTLREGTGAAVTDKDVVALHYKLHVGSQSAPVIQDSREMGQPFVTTTQGVYPGFAEGLKRMKQGGSYVLTLPAGTHEQVANPAAPFTPKDMLVFEIEVLQVERGAAAQFMEMQAMQRLQQMQQMQGGGGTEGEAPGLEKGGR